MLNPKLKSASLTITDIGIGRRVQGIPDAHASMSGIILREIFLSIDINSVAPRGYVCDDPRYRSFLTLDVASFPLAILLANFLIGDWWWAMQIPIFARRCNKRYQPRFQSSSQLALVLFLAAAPPSIRLNPSLLNLTGDKNGNPQSDAGSVIFARKSPPRRNHCVIRKDAFDAHLYDKVAVSVDMEVFLRSASAISYLAVCRHVAMV
ncbi:hypothetical protein G5I_03608 [Acromyrmex echinatior]|uniref:Uncharacterized protein n=1 Tax=Acromyrmex echinatior TaxID=103372 RepID=F4WDF5_ACREC|nr:hypothetical protein G5I_03608 [Acromyrmex echinatior]